MLMVFVMAFVVGGILAAIFQVAAQASKAAPPVLLTVGFALGGCLLPFGGISWLEGVGGGGMTAMVIDAGGALSGSLLTLMTSGNAVSLVMVLCIFVALVLIGALTGAVTKGPKGR